MCCKQKCKVVSLNMAHPVEEEEKLKVDMERGGKENGEDWIVLLPFEIIMDPSL